MVCKINEKNGKIQYQKHTCDPVISFWWECRHHRKIESLQNADIQYQLQSRSNTVYDHLWVAKYEKMTTLLLYVVSKKNHRCTLVGHKSDSLYENILWSIDANFFGCTFQIFTLRQFWGQIWLIISLIMA